MQAIGRKRHGIDGTVVPGQCTQKLNLGSRSRCYIIGNRGAGFGPQWRRGQIGKFHLPQMHVLAMARRGQTVRRCGRISGHDGRTRRSLANWLGRMENTARLNQTHTHQCRGQSFAGIFTVPQNLRCFNLHDGVSVALLSTYYTSIAAVYVVLQTDNAASRVDEECKSKEQATVQHKITYTTSAEEIQCVCYSTLCH